MGEASQTVSCGAQSAVRRRGWIGLCLWILCLAAMLTGQWLTFPAAGSPGMRAEKLWVRLSLASLVLASGAFFVGARWFVHEKSHRLVVRIWGVVATLVALGISLVMSLELWMSHWRMD